MTKDQIEEILRKHSVIKNSKSILEYERAKRLLLSGPMSAEEYSFKIKVITDYVRV